MTVRKFLASNAMASVALAVLASVALPAGGALAQSREIEVYYDDYGRRVISDAYTGEILSIERPRGGGIDRRSTGTVRAQPRYRDDSYDDYARSRDFDEYDPRYDDRVYRERRAPSDDEAYYDNGGAFPEAPSQPERQIRRNTLPQAAAPAPTLPKKSTEPKLQPSNPADVPVIGRKGDQTVAHLQILLDRAGVSPGVIDGRMGSNVEKALSAYNELTGDNLRTTDKPGIEAALEERGGQPFTEYTISQKDAAGPYVAAIPSDYGEKAQLEAMAFTSTLEMLGERFHMSETYLKELNPGANFNRAGTVIRVVNPGSNVLRPVSRIVADKGRTQVRAYDAAGRLVVAYPATIGSSDTPSPVGTHTVERIALNPEYTYNPKINFKQGENDKVLRIPPGPNGPVGSVWIALSKPTYGIHGTPDPSKIGKTNSHGCIRLTNWDAQELAKLVKKGVTVQFVE